MNRTSLPSLLLLSIGLALAPAGVRADDPSSPPVPPPAPGNPDTSPGDGQTPAPHRHWRSRGFVLGELTAKLNLTAEQQKAIGAILANSDSQLKDLRGDDSLSMEDKRAKMKQINESTRSQIRAGLTPSQQKIFDTLPANGGRRGQPPPAAPTEPPAN